MNLLFVISGFVPSSSFRTNLTTERGCCWSSWRSWRSLESAVEKVLLSLHLYSKLALQSGRTAATPELIRLTNWNKKIYFYKLTASLQHLCVHLWFQTVVCCHVILSNRTCSFFLQHLRKLNNFNSYLSILSALDSAPLRRLDWQKSTSEVRPSSLGLFHRFASVH